MSTTRMTPDELLWKLAYLAANSEQKAGSEKHFWLDLQDTTALLRQIKEVLPSEAAWSLYFTPAIVWSTVSSVLEHRTQQEAKESCSMIIALVRGSVASLTTALNSEADSAKQRKNGPLSGMRGILTTP